MKHYYVLVSFLICLFEFINASPTETPSNYTNHTNYKRLPSKDVCGYSKLIDKIAGGKEAELGEFPWIVRLKYESAAVTDQFRCAGSLINERYVVTAAHCIVNQTKVIQVRLGEHDERIDPDEDADPVEDVDVEEIILYPGYNTDAKQDDIALIRLKKTITITDWNRPICLPLNGEVSKFMNEKRNYTVAGWGLTEKNVTSPIKLYATVPKYDLKTCEAIFRQTGRKITAKQICAGGEEGVDSCSGDSGGPLQIDGIHPSHDTVFLAGIVSFGERYCGRKAVPGVYTNVASYIDWILNNMKPF